MDVEPEQIIEVVTEGWREKTREVINDAILIISVGWFVYKSIDNATDGALDVAIATRYIRIKSEFKRFLDDREQVKRDRNKMFFDVFDTLTDTDEIREDRN